MCRTQTVSDHEAKLTAVLRLCELYRPPLSDDAAELFVAALGDLTTEQVVLACAKLATTAKFRPVPAEVREAAGAVEAKATNEDRAAMAFNALSRAISKHGHWSSPDFDDPYINATVRNLGGWQRVCDMDEDQFDTWYRKEFVKVYEMFARCGANPEQVAPLMGAVEAANIAQGYRDEKFAQRAKVKTGLPWAGQPIKRLGAPETVPNVPRIGVQKAEVQRG